MNRDREILIDLIRACELSIQFCQDLDLQAFSQDLNGARSLASFADAGSHRKTQSSVLYQIVIIGEAINRLSANFALKNPQIPIRQIRGMRNRIVHEYKEVDLEILWLAIQTDIPKLLTELKKIN